MTVNKRSLESVSTNLNSSMGNPVLALLRATEYPTNVGVTLGNDNTTFTITGSGLTVAKGLRVTLSGSVIPSNMSGTLYMVPIFGSTTTFRLAATLENAIAATPVPIVADGPLSSGTITVLEVTAQDTLESLVLYEVEDIGRVQASTPTQSFNNLGESVTSYGPATFTNSGNSTLAAPTHILFLYGGNTTYQDTNATYYGITPVTLGQIPPLASVNVNFKRRLGS